MTGFLYQELETAMTERLTLNQYIIRYYPLVAFRIVSLKWMADRLETTPQALRSRAYRLGVTGRYAKGAVEIGSLFRAMRRGEDAYFKMNIEAR